MNKLLKGSWFPVMANQVACPLFCEFTPAEKVFYWKMASDLNLRGPFFRADVDYAAALALSVSKIREARRTFYNSGLIHGNPGTRVGGRNLATTYVQAEWDRPIHKCGQYSKIHRFTFESVLAELRDKQLRHVDVAAYVYLAYLWDRHCSRPGIGELAISTKQWVGITRIAEPVRSFETLNRAVRSTADIPIFEFKSAGGMLIISKLCNYEDPKCSERSQQAATAFDEDIRSRAKALRARRSTGDAQSAVRDTRLDDIFG